MIIAALGTPAIDWLGVQRPLAPEVPVVVYDRGGIGWSDPGPGRGLRDGWQMSCMPCSPRPASSRRMCRPGILSVA